MVGVFREDMMQSMSAMTDGRMLDAPSERYRLLTYFTDNCDRRENDDAPVSAPNDVQAPREKDICSNDLVCQWTLGGTGETEMLPDIQLKRGRNCWKNWRQLLRSQWASDG